MLHSSCACMNHCLDLASGSEKTRQSRNQVQVSFVKGTHYVFTCGKDGALKYWDADRWELLLSLGGHRGETWALAVSSLGDFVITGGFSYPAGSNFCTGRQETVMSGAAA